jgi:preprotein translocase subunit SecA
MNFLTSLFKGPAHGEVLRAKKIVESINRFESALSVLSDSELQAKTAYFKEQVKAGISLDALLPEAFAVVREASKRKLGMRHFDVQMIGGIMLHEGKIAEMRTGEGKTLVATLPLYLNAISGEGAHLVTVNDYLSRRDGVWMGELFNFLGLSVGIINHDASFLYDPTHTELEKEKDEVASFKVVHEFLRPVSRKDAYYADITYGTNNEFGFDYLRDNITSHKGELKGRPFNFAIVDEVDSILIDEARTPLIISGPSNNPEELYRVFAKIAGELVPIEDYTIDEKYNSIALTDSGIEKAEKILGVENIYTEKGIKYVHHLETAVRARALYRKDKEYVVKDGEVIIVDELTGRMQPGRRWSEGLHQAIEAKEGVSIKEETRTYASITFQNYFRLYKKLSGMTGTAETSKEEFLKVYGLFVVPIPTHIPVKRIDRNDQIFQTEQGKFKAIAKKVKELHAKGQPVLIGTVSIEKNELLSRYLTREGIPHALLNAKNHEREGEIIAEAGKKGAVTIATNMAGRGVDIKLGGVPYSDEKAEEVKKLGGLFVLGTERHEARRIDNQLRGRAGRQGDPGETVFYVSMEDSLMRVFANDLIKGMLGRLGLAEDEAVENRLITRSLETAQNRIEGFHFDARKHVLEFDMVLNHQRKIIYDKRRKILVGTEEEVKETLKSYLGSDGALISLIESNIKEVGEDVFIRAARALMLQSIDFFWMDHLETMDYLRGSVNLRAYGQRDPLVEYKKEGLKLFKEMEISIAESIKNALANMRDAKKLKEVEVVEASGLVDTFEESSDRQGAIKNTSLQNRGTSNIGRNDPCPCGSGKKWKKCGEVNSPEHQSKVNK